MATKQPKMTKRKALKELRELQQAKDLEAGHIRADEILCELLAELGYQSVVREWEKLDKYYA